MSWKEIPENFYSKNKFLVTGGAGFIGSHIAEHLLQNKASLVRVMDNLATGSKDNLKILERYSNFEFIEGDIRNENDCNKACEGIDFVSHQAALGSVPRSIEKPMDTHEVNATGFIRILLAARDNKVKRVVYASSSSVYGDADYSPKIEHTIGKPLSPYAVSKLVNEQYAAIFSTTYNMEIIGLRYFNIFGPRQNPKGPYAAAIPLFIESLLKNLPVYINGDGNQSRDFTYVQNAVQANIKAMASTNANAINKVYNIACGSSISVNAMFSVIKEILKVNQEAIHRGERFGDVKNSMANIDFAKSNIGYQPEIGFDEGIKNTIAYYKTIL
jgi:UDP-N-acetylglucosamine 4-epimerase